MLVLLLAGLALGCADPREEPVRRGVALARRTIERVNTDPLAAAAFEDLAGLGGTLTTWVLANAPEDAKLPAYRDGGVPEPWTVRLRQEAGTGFVLIEGFGASTAAPLVAERFEIRPLREP